MPPGTWVISDFYLSQSSMNGFSGQWDKVNYKIFLNEVAPTSTEQGKGRAGTPSYHIFASSFAIFCPPFASIWIGGKLHHPQISTLSSVWEQKPSHSLALPFQKYNRVLFCLGCTAAVFASPTPQWGRFCSLEMNWKDLEQELSSAAQSLSHITSPSLSAGSETVLQVTNVELQKI